MTSRLSPTSPRAPTHRRFTSLLAAAGLGLAALVDANLQAGGVFREVYLDIPGSSLDDLFSSEKFPDQPDATSLLPEFEAPTDLLDDYGQRIRGYLVPPATGDYVFWIASDDQSVLYLSSDESPANKVDIAGVPGWTNSREWTKYPSQQTGAIRLEAGKVYYIEALMKEGGGGDNLAVRWQLPSGTLEEPIPEVRLYPYGTVFGPPVISEQPHDQTVTEGQPATFSVRVSNPDLIAYQWQRNGGPIADARAATYTLAAAALSDQGARFSCVLSNSLGTIATRTATLSVTPDAAAPQLLTAYNVGLNRIIVVFSEPVELATAQDRRNYSLDGGVTVQFASPEVDPRRIALSISDLTVERRYRLTVNGVRDRAAKPNVIAPNSAVTFDASPFAPADVGDPLQPGSITLMPGGVDLVAAGTGIGPRADQFHFAYQERTGDFDYQVRLESLGLSDLWATAGLMARASFAPDSLFAATLATPNLSGVYFASRLTNSASTASAPAPVNYPDTWLRLRRAGDVFGGYVGYDGETWLSLGTVTNPLPARIYVGLAVSSRSPDQAVRAQFRQASDVTHPVTVTAFPDLEPLGPSSRRTGLVISEIMYHPAPHAGANTEFIELFNSQPTSQDLSGYRLAGSIGFTFPTGTKLPAGGFIVVAQNPGAIPPAVNAGPVLGPFTGELPDGGGTVELLHPSGAVWLEVTYSDDAPWPVAADGTGHSLTLTRPSYGERDPRAWSASSAIGGSPGRFNPIAQDRLAALTINEFLAHTDDPVRDYVELYNHSRAELDLAGVELTDDRDIPKFIFPPGTRLGPGGFLALSQDQLGFALSSSGETLYLYNPGRSRVLDAIRFTAQANGVATGRFPDGSPGFHALQRLTPGQPNSPPLLPPVVINEIYYHPPADDGLAEFVELYNRGPTAVDLSAWRFTAGIDFAFPAGTAIPSRGYLVVAKDVPRLLTHYPDLKPQSVVGNYQGQLANAGERVALARPSDPAAPNRDFVVVDEVTYGEGGRWGRWADGGGSSLELVDAHADRRHSSSWADSDETRKAPWTTIETTGTLDHGTDAYGIDRLQLLLMGEGECLLDQVEVIGPTGQNLVANGGFENGATGWVALGTHARSRLESTEGFAGQRSYHLRASGRGSPDANHVYTDLLSQLSPGMKVTLRAKARWLRGHPEILLRLRGNHLEAPGRLPIPLNAGTPGAPNSTARNNLGPALSDVRHRPVLPALGQPVTVTARAYDPDGIASLKLRYRIDPSPTLTTVTMSDNGTGADEIANDGVFTAQIPAQATTNLVAFHVEAIDAANPAASSAFPADAPAQECLVRWGEPLLVGNLASYRLWITQATLDDWTTREPSSNHPLPGTFVYNNQRVVYEMGALYSGSPFHWTGYDSPVGGSCNYVFVFPPDDRLLGATDFVLNLPANLGSDKSAQREQFFYWIADQLGRPSTHRRFCHVYLNGIRRGSLFEDAQQPNRDYLEEWFPDDPDGELYKIEDWFDYDDRFASFQNVDATLEDFRTADGQKKLARYRWNWRKRAVQNSAHDYSEIFDLVDALNTPAADLYTSQVETLVDTEDWMRTFALRHIAGDWDAYGYARGKNMYAYKPTHGRWRLLDWDVAFAFGLGDGPTHDLFAVQHFDGSVDPVTERMYQHPPFRRAYLRALYDAANGPLLAARASPVLQEKHTAINANQIPITSPNSILTWVEQRRTHLLAMLGTNAAAFTMTYPPTSTVERDGDNLLPLEGTAPVQIKTLRINGTAYPVTWTTVTNWRTAYPLRRGPNTLTLTGADSTDRLVPGASAVIQATSRGPERDPAVHLVINEILYHPAADNTGFVEILNTAPDFTFDLTGYRLRGADFRFPEGTIIKPGEHLLVVADRRAFVQHFGPNLRIAGEFSGRLRNDGETITLTRPGPEPGTEILVDRVTYDDQPPWPTSADGTGASLQLIDPGLDNRRAGNWIAVTNDSSSSPGWRFASVTGTAAGSTLFFFLASAGDVHLDDISIVRGTVPEVGANLVRNGDFETAIGAAWTISPTDPLTTRTNGFAHRGNASLHLVTATGGNRLLPSLKQDSLVLPAGETVTLSFWYYPGPSGGGLTAGILGGTVEKTLSLVPIAVGPAPSTPGAPNSIRQTLPPQPALWINELAPENLTGPTDRFGDRDPWLELLNAGSTAATLANLYLTDDLAEPFKSGFPAGTTVAGGARLVVWTDSEPGESAPTEPHASFRLDPSGGSVFLVANENGTPRVLDHVHYPPLPADLSFGSFPEADPDTRQLFHRPTPGQANSDLTGPIRVFINEWLASNRSGLTDPADNDFDDWIELYNPDPAPANLSGFTVTDDLEDPTNWTFPLGSIVPARGFLLIWADNETGQNDRNLGLHAGFRLAQEGEAIALFAPDGSLVDAVRFGPQASDVSEGRFPDGAPAPFHSMPEPTPGQPNRLPTPAGPIATAVTLTGETVRVTWAVQPGRSYQAQYKTDLNASTWIDLGPASTAPTADLIVTDPLASGVPQRFYRLILLP